MNTRCLFLSLGLLAAVACHADPSDGTDETEDAYRVKPKGTSTLGTLTVDVPDGVREGQSVHKLTLHVAAQAADGSVTRDATYFDANKTSAKLPPGKYCLYVDSRVGNLASLHTLGPHRVAALVGRRNRATGVALHFDRHIRANTDDYFKLSEKKQNFRRREAFYGMELVADVQRLALMNARLHDIEGDILLGDTLGPSGAKLPKRSWAGLSVSVKALCQVEVFAGSSPARSRRSSGQYTSRRS